MRGGSALLALALWGTDACAEGLTGRLLDALTVPAESPQSLVAALETQGFGADGVAMSGPADLPETMADPAYFYLRADVLPTDGAGPLILLECSRIGPAMLPSLPSSAPSAGAITLPVVPLLQWAETVAFLDGAASQLRCRADLLPVVKAGTPAALPSRDAIDADLAARFASVTEGPLEDGESPGHVEIIAETTDPARPGEGRRLRYEYRGDGALHSFDLIVHHPAQGG